MSKEVLQRGLDQALATKTADEVLLKEALHLLEYATYHDGRYAQLNDGQWQEAAIKLEKQLCERLGRERYATLKAGGK